MTQSPEPAQFDAPPRAEAARMIEAMHDGPPRAAVDRIDERDIPAEGFERFERR